MINYPLSKTEDAIVRWVPRAVLAAGVLVLLAGCL